MRLWQDDQSNEVNYPIEDIRQHFPILHQMVHGAPLVYLDNAATTQKPESVTQAIVHYYHHDNANVHRGVHTLSERATQGFENARQIAAKFVNAPSASQMIFVRGTTEAINLIAQSYARPLLGTNDEILITHLEHHSNIVPWQMVAEQTGATLKVAPIFEDGSIDLVAYEKLLSDKTKIVAFNHVSNALGTVNPIKLMIELAHKVGAVTVIDGAQAVQHMAVDVQALDADFYAFSSHKAYGPTGIGALYGKAALLDAMQPYQGGGEMITQVSFDKTTYNEVPHKFEAGTPNIAGAIGMGAALAYLMSVGLDKIHSHEQVLLAQLTDRLDDIEGLTIIGTAKEKTSVVSFTLDGIHPHDIGTIVDNEGVAIRTGHHCAMPLMARMGVTATARASLGLYNNLADIERLVSAIGQVQKVFE